MNALNTTSATAALAAPFGEWITDSGRSSLAESDLAAFFFFVEWHLNRQPEEPPSGGGGGLGGGAIAGTVVGVLAGVAGLVLVALMIRQRRGARHVPMEELPKWMSAGIMMRRQTTMAPGAQHQPRMSTANPLFADPDVGEVREALLHRLTVSSSAPPPGLDDMLEADIDLLTRGQPALTTISPPPSPPVSAPSSPRRRGRVSARSGALLGTLAAAVIGTSAVPHADAADVVGDLCSSLTLCSACQAAYAPCVWLPDGKAEFGGTCEDSREVREVPLGALPFEVELADTSRFALATSQNILPAGACTNLTTPAADDVCADEFGEGWMAADWAVIRQLDVAQVPEIRRLLGLEIAPWYTAGMWREQALALKVDNNVCECYGGLDTCLPTMRVLVPADSIGAEPPFEATIIGGIDDMYGVPLVYIANAENIGRRVLCSRNLASDALAAVVQQSVCDTHGVVLPGCACPDPECVQHPWTPPGFCDLFKYSPPPPSPPLSLYAPSPPPPSEAWGHCADYDTCSLCADAWPPCGWSADPRLLGGGECLSAWLDHQAVPAMPTEFNGLVFSSTSGVTTSMRCIPNGGGCADATAIWYVSNAAARGTKATGGAALPWERCIVDAQRAAAAWGRAHSFRAPSHKSLGVRGKGRPCPLVATRTPAHERALSLADNVPQSLATQVGASLARPTLSLAGRILRP